MVSFEFYSTTVHSASVGNLVIFEISGILIIMTGYFTIYLKHSHCDPILQNVLNVQKVIPISVGCV